MEVVSFLSTLFLPKSESVVEQRGDDQRTHSLRDRRVEGTHPLLGFLTEVAPYLPRTVGVGTGADVDDDTSFLQLLFGNEIGFSCPRKNDVGCTRHALQILKGSGDVGCLETQFLEFEELDEGRTHQFSFPDHQDFFVPESDFSGFQQFEHSVEGAWQHQRVSALLGELLRIGGGQAVHILDWRNGIDEQLLLCTDRRGQGQL